MSLDTFNDEALFKKMKERAMTDKEDKEFALQTIMLLSALEILSFSNQVRLPDYLHERLADVVEHLSKKVLHE
jgi:hypothetical protein